MKRYKTIKGLLRQTAFGQINFNELYNGRFYHKSSGYINYSLDDTAREQAYKMMADVVNLPTKALSQYSGKCYGILERLMIDKRGAHYIAGQSYDGEVRTLRRILQK